VTVELPVERPQRIFIIGQSGSGKSTLARRIAATTGIGATDLDLIYRERGGNGPIRPLDARDADLAELLTQPSWIAEGIHLDGSAPLMHAADLIIWLDPTTGWRTTMRIVRRFISGAWYEVRHQRGWRRFFRFGDYARHLRDLARAIPESRAYSSDGDRAPVTRSQVERRLSGYGPKVVRCASADDMDKIVNLLRATATGS
jgi:adenylate kinase family enzyme